MQSAQKNTMRLHRAIKFFYKRIIQPHSSNKDEARREFILNILLTGIVFLTSIGFSINLLHPVLHPDSKGQSPLLTGAILVFIVTLLVVSRSGLSKFSAQVLVWFFLFVGFYMGYYWGADLPALLLFLALQIVMAGILINTKFAFIISILSGIGLLVITQAEIAGIVVPHNEWKREVIHMVDSIVYALILGIIAVVSWLSNKEMEKALKRARTSEAAVKKQRDNLEILVEERTKELKLSQAEKLTQLYHFAEFGKMATGLFHDLANPLTLVSLNLDRLKRQSKNMDQQQIYDTKILLRRAMSGTHRLQKYITSARKQIQNQDVMHLFSLKEEVGQSLQLLEYKSRKKHVQIERNIPKNIMYYGNSIKFNQLVTNLVSNAIDSYDNTHLKNKRVEIRLNENKKRVHLEIQDWGIGISNQDLERIFDPLFTTKSSDDGMGIGLSICRDIAIKYLKGAIDVASKHGQGSTFTVTFPLKKSPKKS